MSGYIMDLRKIVGSRTLIQCAASVIVVDGEGRLLLGKRTDNHLWGYSGGSVEIDERVEDCAARELFEETGITAQSLEFFMVSSGPQVHYIYPNGDEVSNIEIIYICRDYSGEPRRQEEEVEELKWFNPSEIELEMISPPIRPVFYEYFCTFGINRTPNEQKALNAPFAGIYNCLIDKVERKGRTRAELLDITSWLTGYSVSDIDSFKGSYGQFMKNMPAGDSFCSLVTGTVCGVRVETIKDPLVHRLRCLDKLTDELAKGKAADRIKMR